MPLVAVMQRLYVPMTLALGVPVSVAVSLCLSANEMPVGSMLDVHVPEPASVIVLVGNPRVVKVKFPSVRAVNVVLLGLVIAGAWSTVSVKVWVAAGVIALLAVRQRV